MSSAFVIIFVMAFPAVMFEPVGTSTYRVSFRGVRFRCVGLAQKISARCKSASNTGSYVFPFYLFLFLFSFLHSHICTFFHSLSAFPQICKWAVKSHINRTWHPFYHYLFQRTPCYLYLYFSRECFYSLLEHETWFRWVFLSRDSQKLCSWQHKLRNQKQLRPRNSFLTFQPQKANPCSQTF